MKLRCKSTTIYRVAAYTVLFLPGLLFGMETPPRPPIVRDCKILSKALGGKKMPVKVLLPATYNPAKRLPVIYALHGAGGDERTWPAFPALRDAVSKYKVIVVASTAGSYSWYLDSPEKKNARAATYFARDLVPFIDGRFATISSRKARGIMGMSMGGHGAMYLAATYPDVFGSASSMSGIMDLTRHPGSWHLAKVLGPYSRHRERWRKHSAVWLVEALKRGGVKSAVDCGREDFAFPENEAFHKAAHKAGLQVDYRVSPGRHDAVYWNRTVARHIAFHAAAFRAAAAGEKPEAEGSKPPAKGKKVGAEFPQVRLSKALEDVLAYPERELSIENGALLLSKEEHPELDVKQVGKRIKELADRLAGALAHAGTARGKLAALRTLLFETEKFRLPKKDDARAFLLSDVLKSKRGNCLGLSVLCLVLGERAGLPLVGVTIPARDFGSGHLLVRLKGHTDVAGRPLNFDPAEGGTIRSDAYYRKMFKLSDAEVKSNKLFTETTSRDVLDLLLVNLGGERVTAGRAAEAVPLLLRARQLKPDYAPTYNNIGSAYLALGDYDHAGAAYRRALRVWPKFLPARVGRAQIMLHHNRIDAAEKEVRAVLAIEPKNVPALTLLASVFLSRKEYGAARGVLLDAIAENKDNATLYRNLAAVQCAAGDFTAAEKAYRDALAVEPRDAKARAGLAEVLQALGRLREAAAERKKAATSKKTGGEVAGLAAGDAAARARDWPAAEQAYRAALRAAPRNRRVLHGLAAALTAQRKLVEAEGVLNKALRAHPDAHELYGLLGEVRLLRHDPRGAYRALDKAANLTDASSRRPYVRLIAHCYVLLSYYKEALGLTKKLLRVDENDTAALRTAAVACVKLRRNAEAKEYYRRLLKLRPEDTEATRALKSLR